LRTLGAAFLSAQPRSARLFGSDVRFDVASVSVDARGRTDVHLFEDAF
jgi:hypothetical protein